MAKRYIIVVGKKGDRHMMYPHQAGNTFKTRAEAKRRIRNTIKNSSIAQRKQVGFINPSIRRIEVYPHTGDPRQTRF